MILGDELPVRRARSRSPAEVSSAGSDVLDMSPISPSTAEHDTRELLRSLEGERIHPDLPPHSPEQGIADEGPPSPPRDDPVPPPAAPVQEPVVHAPPPRPERKRPAEEEEDQEEEPPTKRAKAQATEDSDSSSGSSDSDSSSDDEEEEEEERRRKRRRRRKRKQAKKERKQAKRDRRRQEAEMNKTMVALVAHLLQGGQGALATPPQWAPAWPTGTGQGQFALAPFGAMPPPSPQAPSPFHPPHFQ